jgi:GNAT superfamily N-acetyltransferase
VRVDVDTRPLGPGDLDDLALLFGAQRSTKHCWCMAFCASGGQFAAGWFGGGNRRRFERVAGASATPMGVLASVGGAPVGWGACGPRSRYTAAIDGRSSLLRGRPREEGDGVWLVACLFVAPTHRRLGVTHALVRAAVDLSRKEGALAVEGWPLTASAPQSGDAFVGREEVFRAAGFECVDRPTPQRAVMRLDLRDPRGAGARDIDEGVHLSD